MRVLRAKIPFLLEKSLIVPNYIVVRLENTEILVNLNRDGLILFTF